MYTGWDKTHPGIVQGVGELSKVGVLKNDIYYDYYAAQVLRHYGGVQWDKFNVELRDWLVSSQSQSGGEKGSWHFPNSQSHRGPKEGWPSGKHLVRNDDSGSLLSPHAALCRRGRGRRFPAVATLTVPTVGESLRDSSRNAATLRMSALEMRSYVGESLRDSQETLRRCECPPWKCVPT